MTHRHTRANPTEVISPLANPDQVRRSLTPARRAASDTMQTPLRNRNESSNTESSPRNSIPNTTPRTDIEGVVSSPVSSPPRVATAAAQQQRGESPSLVLTTNPTTENLILASIQSLAGNFGTVQHEIGGMRNQMEHEIGGMRNQMALALQQSERTALTIDTALIQINRHATQTADKFDAMDKRLDTLQNRIMQLELENQSLRSSISSSSPRESPRSVDHHLISSPASPASPDYQNHQSVTSPDKTVAVQVDATPGQSPASSNNQPVHLKDKSISPVNLNKRCIPEIPLSAVTPSSAGGNSKTSEKDDMLEFLRAWKKQRQMPGTAHTTSLSKSLSSKDNGSDEDSDWCISEPNKHLRRRSAARRKMEKAPHRLNGKLQSGILQK